MFFSGSALSIFLKAEAMSLENGGADIRYETDFRAIYAAIFDRWLGADSVSILGGNFRSPGLQFI